MKSESPHNLENRSLPLEEAFGQIRILKAIHEAEYGVLAPAKNVLTDEGEYEENEQLFDKAESSYRELEEFLKGILEGEEVTESDFQNIDKLSREFSFHNKAVRDLLNKFGFEVVKNLVDEKGNVIEEIPDTPENEEPVQLESVSVEEDGDSYLEALGRSLEEDFNNKFGKNRRKKPSSRGNFYSVDEEDLNQKRVEPHMSDADIKIVDPEVEPTLSTIDAVSEDTTIETAVAQAVEENLITPETETESNSENGVKELVEKYRTAIDKNELFKTSGEAEDRPFKKLKVIIAEIRSALEHVGFEEEVVDDFMDTYVDAQRKLIVELNKDKKDNKNDIDKVSSLEEEINKIYQALFSSVAETLKTGKIYKEFTNQELVSETKLGTETEVVTGKSVTEEITNIEGIDNLIEAEIANFEKLKSEFTAGELVEKANDIITNIYGIIESIGRYHESDEARSVQDKQRYLKVLRRSISQLSELKLIENEPEDTSSGVIEGVATRLTEYEGQRKIWAETKSEFKEKEKEYKTALESYYGDTSVIAKLRASANGVKKLFGISPELPPALRQMQSEYKQLRTVYAESLDSVLTERSKSIEANKEYSLESDQTKMAFGQKFILKPNQEMLSLQEQRVLSPEVQEKMIGIMKTLSKYKWHSRLGRVALAGAIGAATGGAGALAVGAGWQAWRIAASSMIAIKASNIVREKMQGRIERAKQNLPESEQAVLKKFSLEDLNTLEQQLERAQSTKERMEKQQKVATVVAAAVGGFATGATLGHLGAEHVLNSTVTPPPSESVVSGVDNDDSGLSDASFKPEPAPFVDMNPGGQTEAVSQSSNLEVGDLSPENITSFIPKLSVQHFSPSGDFMGETVLSKINLIGLNDEVLSMGQRVEVGAFLKLTANDILSAHPNISETNLEAELLDKLQNKYGGTAWWSEANISKVDVGSIKTDFSDSSEVASGHESLPETASEEVSLTLNTEDVNIKPLEIVIEGEASGAVNATETAEVVSQNAGQVYEVAKGDTLWEIVEKKFADELNVVSPDKHNQIIDALVDKIQTDAHLRDSLGLRSGDPDLIYAGEKINLEQVEDQLNTLISREQILAEFKGSTTLPIEADEAIKNIPINVIESPTVPVEAVEAEHLTHTVEQTPIIQKIADIKPVIDAAVETPVVPKIFSFDGNYLSHPEYKDFILKSFGSEKLFNQVIEKEVTNIDNAHYDFFDRSSFFGGGNFVSPYTLMKEMPLKQIEEFGKMPGDELRVFLEENNIKYNNYLAWNDKIESMKDTLPHSPTTTLADLFSRFVAENKLPPVNTLTHKI